MITREIKQFPEHSRFQVKHELTKIIYNFCTMPKYFSSAHSKHYSVTTPRDIVVTVTDTLKFNLTKYPREWYSNGIVTDYLFY